MASLLDVDLKSLQGLAYHRADWAEEALRRYHAATPNLDAAQVHSLRRLYNWMFVPITLWPFNIQDVLEDCLAALEKGKRLTSRHRLLIDFLPDPPDETICAAVAAHELQVQKGVIRRTMSAERNLRPSFSVNCRRRDDVFQAAFDAFCLRWNLYGRHNAEPLLLKLAVNLTPYGTMIASSVCALLNWRGPERNAACGTVPLLHSTFPVLRSKDAKMEEIDHTVGEIYA